MNWESHLNPGDNDGYRRRPWGEAGEGGRCQIGKKMNQHPPHYKIELVASDTIVSLCALVGLENSENRVWESRSAVVELRS